MSGDRCSITPQQIRTRSRARTSRSPASNTSLRCCVLLKELTLMWPPQSRFFGEPLVELPPLDYHEPTILPFSKRAKQDDFAYFSNKFWGSVRSRYQALGPASSTICDRLNVVQTRFTTAGNNTCHDYDYDFMPGRQACGS